MLSEILQALSDPDPGTRERAERRMEMEAQQNPVELVLGLTHVAFSRDSIPGVQQQLAVLLLKQCVAVEFQRRCGTFDSFSTSPAHFKTAVTGREWLPRIPAASAAVQVDLHAAVEAELLLPEVDPPALLLQSRAALAAAWLVTELSSGHGTSVEASRRVIRECLARCHADIQDEIISGSPSSPSFAFRAWAFLVALIDFVERHPRAAAAIRHGAVMDAPALLRAALSFVTSERSSESRAAALGAVMDALATPTFVQILWERLCSVHYAVSMEQLLDECSALIGKLLDTTRIMCVAAREEGAWWGTASSADAVAAALLRLVRLLFSMFPCVLVHTGGAAADVLVALLPSLSSADFPAFPCLYSDTHITELLGLLVDMGATDAEEEVAAADVACHPVSKQRRAEFAEDICRLRDRLTEHCDMCIALLAKWSPDVCEDGASSFLLEANSMEEPGVVVAAAELLTLIADANPEIAVAAMLRSFEVCDNGVSASTGEGWNSHIAGLIAAQACGLSFSPGSACAPHEKSTSLRGVICKCALQVEAPLVAAYGWRVLPAALGCNASARLPLSCPSDAEAKYLLTVLIDSALETLESCASASRCGANASPPATISSCCARFLLLVIHAAATAGNDDDEPNRGGGDGDEHVSATSKAAVVDAVASRMERIVQCFMGLICQAALEDGDAAATPSEEESSFRIEEELSLGAHVAWWFDRTRRVQTLSLLPCYLVELPLPTQRASTLIAEASLALIRDPALQHQASRTCAWAMFSSATEVSALDENVLVGAMETLCATIATALSTGADDACALGAGLADQDVEELLLSASHLLSLLSEQYCPSECVREPALLVGLCTMAMRRFLWGLRSFSIPGSGERETDRVQGSGQGSRDSVRVKHFLLEGACGLLEETATAFGEAGEGSTDRAFATALESLRDVVRCCDSELADASDATEVLIVQQLGAMRISATRNAQRRGPGRKHSCPDKLHSGEERCVALAHISSHTLACAAHMQISMQQPSFDTELFLELLRMAFPVVRVLHRGLDDEARSAGDGAGVDESATDDVPGQERWKMMGSAVELMASFFSGVLNTSGGGRCGGSGSCEGIVSAAQLCQIIDAAVSFANRLAVACSRTCRTPEPKAVLEAWFGVFLDCAQSVSRLSTEERASAKGVQAVRALRSDVQDLLHLLLHHQQQCAPSSKIADRALRVIDGL